MTFIYDGFGPDADQGRQPTLQDGRAWACATRLPPAAGLAARARNALCIAPRHHLAGGALCGAEVSAAPGGLDAGPVSGAWLLRAACAEATSWPLLRMQQAGLGVTVALPGLGLCAGTLLAQAEAALQGSGLEEGRLDLAFPAVGLEDAGPDLILLVSALRDLGAGVALDGVVRNTDSLRVLRRLPLTTIRLHPILVRGVEADAGARAALARMIRSAHALGAVAVALGVETALQRDILADLRCDSAQGGLFAGLLTAQAFRGALAAGV